MSSFPGRAELAVPTVYSIMYGRRVPDAFYFWVALNVTRLVPDGETGKIPEPAVAVGQQFSGIVRVAAAPHDWGPATKLLPTLREETDADTVIITVDDDTYYHPDTVLDLEAAILERPGHAIVRSCELTHLNASHDPPRWKEWKLDEGLCAGFMTAYASAAYRRGFFDEAVFDQDAAPDACRHHDDIWFSGHLWLRGVPVWILKPFEHAWPPMYHMPKNRMSISAHPDTNKKQVECLDYWGWLQDQAVRKRLRRGRATYKQAGGEPVRKS
ncbi:hypothetical protein HT031_006244 [Scenedesmus sp. PABB004]|nr:hypothetical protein HT031_006244 [Scenedesmus sp. PABB004]